LDNISRTKRKQAAEGLQDMGAQLVDLDVALLETLELPDDLKEAVAAARKIKSHGARKRQLQYIGRLMRQYDTEMVQVALQKMEGRQDQERRRFKRVERWRDELVSGDDVRLDWLLQNFAQIDQQQLRRLVGCARGLDSQMNPKEAGRKLFRLLSRLEGDGS
jgi:ribosome-associated protein